MPRRWSLSMSYDRDDGTPPLLSWRALAVALIVAATVVGIIIIRAAT